MSRNLGRLIIKKNCGKEYKCSLILWRDGELKISYYSLLVLLEHGNVQVQVNRYNLLYY